MFFNFEDAKVGDTVGYSPRESYHSNSKRMMWSYGSIIKKTKSTVKVKFKDGTEKTFTSTGNLYGEGKSYSFSSSKAQLQLASDVEEHNKEAAIHNARVSLNNHIQLKLEKITLLCKQSEGNQLRKINAAFDKIIKEAEGE